MLYPSLTAQQKKWYRAAIESPARFVHVKVRLFDAAKRPLDTIVILHEGQIQGERAKDQAPVTGHFSFLDPYGRLKVHLKATGKGLWFSRSVQILYGLWVPEMDRWVYAADFFGPIQAITRSDIVVEVDCASQEIQHLPDHFLVAPWTRRKHWRVTLAIRKLFRSRGETKFEIARAARRVRRSRTYAIGSVPMAIGYQLAGALSGTWDLFFRANAALCLRQRRRRSVMAITKLLVAHESDQITKAGVHDTVLMIGEKKVKTIVSNKTSLAQKYTGGNTIVVNTSTHVQVGKKVVIGTGAKQRTRLVTNKAGTTITLKKGIALNYPKGAPVEVFHTGTKKKPIYARASLPRGHSMSAQTITAGKRPSVRIIRRPGIHKEKRLRAAARSAVRREGKVHQEISFTCSYIPGLELYDVLSLNTPALGRDVTVQRFLKDLVNHTTDCNWTGAVPMRKG